MVNASLNWASIAGIIGIFSAIYCYQLKIKFPRITGNEFADMTSAFFVPLLVIASSLIIFFQGWRLDLILQAAFVLLLCALVYETWYSSGLDIVDVYSRKVSEELRFDESNFAPSRSVSINSARESDEKHQNQLKKLPEMDSSSKGSSLKSISSELLLLSQMLESGELAQDEYRILRQRIISGGSDFVEG